MLKYFTWFISAATMSMTIGYRLVQLHRTAIKDSFLKANLDGYTSYTDAVRYRLVPRLW